MQLPHIFCVAFPYRPVRPGLARAHAIIQNRIIGHQRLTTWNDMKLTQFKALTFDVYGTLIDWESGMIAALRKLTDRLPQKLGRNQILEAHAFHESKSQRLTPTKTYAMLLALVHKRLAEEWEIPVDWNECVKYGQSVKDWPAFPDSAEALRYLKRHYRLGVLSNTDNESFAHSNARLHVEFDATFLASDMGSYKPDRRNFDYMIENLARRGIEKHEILHIAESMFHDHVPARACGIANCWIYRRHAEEGFGATMEPAEMPGYDLMFHSLADLVKAHRTELASR